MVLNSNQNHTTDGPAFQMLSQVNSPVPIVLISRANDFVFNEELLKLDKYVLCCFSEYGWDVDLSVFGTHIWGENTDLYTDQVGGPEYEKFDNFVSGNKPILTLKRELLKDDVSDNILPIEYANLLPPIPLQSREQFYSRPLDFFHFFGRSNENRLLAHAKAWEGASKYGYSLCDNIYHFNNFMQNESGRKSVSLWQPHYCRIEISELLKINQMAKISMALGGAGGKTFRHTEVSSSAVMFTWDDELAWTYPWVNEENCIMGHPGLEISTIMAELSNPQLYEIYCNCVATSEKYRLQNYIAHLEKQIHARL